NDSETERRTYVARISERVLRELYLPPFEACVNEADVFLVMAAYNAVNGATMTANSVLLQQVLKADWGFTGVVISDWSATTTTGPSALAGLDLVMPGPNGPWGDQLVAAVQAGTVPEAEIDDKVSRLLLLASRVGALGQAAEADPSVGPLIDPALLREVAARSFVMLHNQAGLLPLTGGVRTVALIGPNATDPQTQGGGSVRVLPVGLLRLHVARIPLGEPGPFLLETWSRRSQVLLSCGCRCGSRPAGRWTSGSTTAPRHEGAGPASSPCGWASHPRRTRTAFSTRQW